MLLALPPFHALRPTPHEKYDMATREKGVHCPAQCHLLTHAEVWALPLHPIICDAALCNKSLCSGLN